MIDHFLTQDTHVIPDYIRRVAKCLLASGAVHISGVSIGYSEQTGWFICGRERGGDLKTIFTELNFPLSINLETRLSDKEPTILEKATLTRHPHKREAKVGKVKRVLKHGVKAYSPRIVLDGLALEEAGFEAGSEYVATIYAHGLIRIVKR